MAHTSGPWEWRDGVLYAPEGSRNLYAIINDGGCRIHRTRMVAVDEWQREQEANRKLIAAAPELLDALHAIASKLSERAKNAGQLAALTVQAYDIAEAAIAKAEGRS